MLHMLPMLRLRLRLGMEGDAAAGNGTLRREPFEVELLGDGRCPLAHRVHLLCALQITLELRHLPRIEEVSVGDGGRAFLERGGEALGGSAVAPGAHVPRALDLQRRRLGVRRLARVGELLRVTLVHHDAALARQARGLLRLLLRAVEGRHGLDGRRHLLAPHVQLRALSVHARPLRVDESLLVGRAQLADGLRHDLVALQHVVQVRDVARGRELVLQELLRRGLELRKLERAAAVRVERQHQPVQLGLRDVVVAEQL